MDEIFVSLMAGHHGCHLCEPHQSHNHGYVCISQPDHDQPASALILFRRLEGSESLHPIHEEDQSHKAGELSS